MPDIHLTIRDATEDISGACCCQWAAAALAALSADPTTIAELTIAMERFCRRPKNGGFFRRFARRLNDQPHDAGLVLIDLAARFAVVDSKVLTLKSNDVLGIHDESTHTKTSLPLGLDDDWLLAPSREGWREQAERRRREFSLRPLRDVRIVLYGRPLLEFVARGCLEAFARRPEFEAQARRAWIEWRLDCDAARRQGGAGGRPAATRQELERWTLAELAPNTRPGQERYASPYYEAIKQIHADWLLTPRPELDGDSPRQTLIARRHHIARDIQDRCSQWQSQGECPRGLDESSAAYRLAGVGVHESIEYYELVRELLWSCWERLEQMQADGEFAEQPPTAESFVPDEASRLEEVRERWLDTPDPEFHRRTPRSIIAKERARLPEGFSGGEAMIDPDCPCCQMMADMPGPVFMHLDTSGFDEGFAFDLQFATREEWEEEQKAFDELGNLGGDDDANGADDDAGDVSDQDDDARTNQAATGQANGDGASRGDGPIWSRSFVAPESSRMPLAVRLFGIGACLAELIVDLRDDGDQGPDASIDALNRNFRNLRDVLGQIDGTVADSLVSPVVGRFVETLGQVAEKRPRLERKCQDLSGRLERFLDPYNGLGDGSGDGRPTSDDESPI